MYRSHLIQLDCGFVYGKAVLRGGSVLGFNSHEGHAVLAFRHASGSNGASAISLRAPHQRKVPTFHFLVAWLILVRQGWQISPVILNDRLGSLLRLVHSRENWLSVSCGFVHGLFLVKDSHLK